MEAFKFNFLTLLITFPTIPNTNENEKNRELDLIYADFAIC